MDKTNEQKALGFEATRVKTLINLATESGIDPGLSAVEVDVVVIHYDASLPDTDGLAYTAALSRLRDMHRHLHELLYAPPRR